MISIYSATMMPITNVPYFQNSVTGFPAITVPSALPMGHVMPPVAAAAPSIGSPLTINAGSPLPLEGVCSCGTLVWITPTAGAIKANDIGLVWFEIKDFCDQAVTDLTAVLRIGFVLKFTAVSYKNEKLPQIRHCATFVAPMFASDYKLASSYSGSADMVEYLVKSLDCSDEIFHREDPTRKSERYDLELEARALPFVIRYFVENKTYKLELVVMHMHISNTEQKDMYDYIGKSSQKRTMYFEKRSHLFSIRNGWVILVPPCIHNTILLLSNMIMERGGATLLQELFDFYLACPDVSLAAREMIGEGKNRFVQLLEAHPWAFSVFPSRVFVSVRRRLIEFGYEKQVKCLDQDPDYEMVMQQRASPLLTGAANRSQQGTPTPLPLHGTQANGSNRSSPPNGHQPHLQQSNINGHHFVGTHQPPPPHTSTFPPVSVGLYNSTYAMQSMHQPPHPSGIYVPPPQNGPMLASAPGGTFRPIDSLEKMYAPGTFSGGSAVNHAHHHPTGTAPPGYGHHGNAGQSHHAPTYMGMLGRLPNGTVPIMSSITSNSTRDSPMIARRPETCETSCQTDYIIGTAEMRAVGRKLLITEATQTDFLKTTADADSQTNDSMYDPWKRSAAPAQSTDCLFSSQGLIGFNGFNTLMGFSDHQHGVTQAHENNTNNGNGTMLVGDLLAEKLGKFTFGGL